MGGCWSAFASFNSSYREDNWRTQQAGDGNVAKIVDVGINRGLLVQAIREHGQVAKLRHVRADVV